MEAEAEVVWQLIEPVVEWLDGGGDPGPMIDAYWAARRAHFDARGEVERKFWDLGARLSNIDVATDSYDPESDLELPPRYTINESQLRAELIAAVDAIAAMGFLQGR